MNRKEFIQSVGLLAGGLLLTGNVEATPKVEVNLELLSIVSEYLKTADRVWLGDKALWIYQPGETMFNWAMFNNRKERDAFILALPVHKRTNYLYEGCNNHSWENELKWRAELPPFEQNGIDYANNQMIKYNGPTVMRYPYTMHYYNPYTFS